MKITVFLIYIALLKNNVSWCAKILFVAPVPSYSHQIFYRKIWLTLAAKGHDLTVLTTDVMKGAPRNVRQIDWQFAYDIRHLKHNVSKASLKNEGNIAKLIEMYGRMLDDVVHRELETPEVKKLLNGGETFDLLIVEYHHPVVFAFSSYFGCPYIGDCVLIFYCSMINNRFAGISSGQIYDAYHHILGNPTHPLLHPTFLLPFKPEDTLNFYARVRIVKAWIQCVLRAMQHDTSKVDAIIGKYFGDNMPPLEDILSNVSLVLINTHILFDSRPLMPGVIRIGGGTHLTAVKTLPLDVKNFLDSADNGVIYFSLGTNVRSECLQGRLLDVFINSFKELPYKVLWKFDVPLKNVSRNVKIVNWVPQADVLRHKNIKLFITQAGLQSIEESIFSHVPMVAIPFVSDQTINAYKISEKGLGLYLDQHFLTKEVLMQGILKVIDGGYKENVVKAASYLQDQPMSGLDTAIWWIEYVIRHKGTKHLWTLKKPLPFYQYYLIDVLAYLVAYNLIPVILMGYIIRKCVLYYVKKRN